MFIRLVNEMYKVVETAKLYLYCLLTRYHDCTTTLYRFVDSLYS
jgi:hypothetical protein